MDRKFAVIGHPIGHTMSPFLNARLFSLSGLPAQYTSRDIAPESLPDSLGFFRSLQGFNVTIPHKQAIIPFLDDLDPSARNIQSVNTVKQVNGRLIGYTTDGAGFRFALENAGIPLKGNVLILGAGGVSRVMALEALEAGCRLTIAARNPEKAQSLASQLPASSEEITVLSLETLEKAPRSFSFDLAVNGTPVGMHPHPDASPLGKEAISRCAAVFDAVYNPGETLFLQLAKSGGAKTAGGMPMLVGQAAAAHKIWDGAQYSTQVLQQLCLEAEEEMKRIFGGV